MIPFAVVVHLSTADEVRILSQNVYQLPFPLVPPLPTQHHCDTTTTSHASAMLESPGTPHLRAEDSKFHSQAKNLGMRSCGKVFGGVAQTLAEHVASPQNHCRLLSPLAVAMDSGNLSADV